MARARRLRLASTLAEYVYRRVLAVERVRDHGHLFGSVGIVEPHRGLVVLSAVVGRLLPEVLDPAIQRRDERDRVAVHSVLHQYADH